MISKYQLAACVAGDIAAVGEAWSGMLNIALPRGTFDKGSWALALAKLLNPCWLKLLPTAGMLMLKYIVVLGMIYVGKTITTFITFELPDSGHWYTDAGGWVFGKTTTFKSWFSWDCVRVVGKLLSRILTWTRLLKIEELWIVKTKEDPPEPPLFVQLFPVRVPVMQDVQDVGDPKQLAHGVWQAAQAPDCVK